ncbi:MAG TPA: asparagine synthase-related protein [Sphingomicrobium sp.]|nr:asparagine synthase-related protein [Sphingomicrobium sp.]
MLRAQDAYGNLPARADVGPLSLGRNLHPMLPEDVYDRGPIVRGPHALVADVRIDNREEIERSLGIGTDDAARQCDAAILFEALIAWGSDALNRLTGEFALAFWDGQRRRLLLARDVLGSRPLVFHRAPDFFAFASMPSGLHAIPGVPYAVNPEHLAESLAMLPERGSGTFFKGVDRVEPAHFLEITETSMTSSRFWQPSRPSGKRLNPREYEEALRSVVDAATRAQLRGAGNTVAAQLSGGLDSSIVVTSAARQMPDRTIVAYTAVPRRGFDGPIPPGVLANEADRAAATAGLYSNVEHVIVENGEQSPLDLITRAFPYQQQPVPNPCNNVWATSICRLARERGATVLLIGNAGNLTATYYGLQWLPELLRRGRLVKLARMSLGARRHGFRWLSVGAQVVGPFLPMGLWKRLSARVTELRQYAPVSPALSAALERKAGERGMDFSYRPRRDPFALRLWSLTRFDNGICFKGILGQWGLSVRDPLADKRVIEFCLSVPDEEYLRDGVPRSLARRAFGDRLPAEVTNATVRALQSPDWYEGLEKDWTAIRAEIAQIARSADVETVIDTAWLEESAASWPATGWEREDVIMRYRHGLLYGLSVGHFMRRVAGTN